MSCDSEHFNPSTKIQLNDIRNALIRQEETIIFALVERSQFPRNSEVYKKRGESDGLALSGSQEKHNDFQGSFFEFLFMQTEKVHALAGRYTSPDENAFYPQHLPQPFLPPIKYSQLVKPNQINVNLEILNTYMHKILPGITRNDTDSTSFGSATLADIAVLQALSKRIHFGKYVAEAKYQANPEKYAQLIQANDVDGIMATLTDLHVEQKVLDRVKLKATTYSQDISANKTDLETDAATLKVDPQLISDSFREFVMPMTKHVQVKYLIGRLHHPGIAVAGGPDSFAWIAAERHFGSCSSSNFLTSNCISDIFNQVESATVAYGVVPFEDSDIGILKETKSLLIRGSTKVVAVLVMPKKLLFGVSEKGMLEHHAIIEQVYVPFDVTAHVCRHIQNIWPNATIVLAKSFIEAASKAASSSSAKRSAAVTVHGAAKAYALETMELPKVLHDSIDRSQEAYNRYAVIAKSCPPATGKDYSFYSITLEQKPSALVNVLQIWERNGVETNCLELSGSNMAERELFFEIAGHCDDAKVQNGIDALKANNHTVKHLGSFPVISVPS